MKAKIVLKGGAGSGNWGHVGRPGKVGGSTSNRLALSLTRGRDWHARQQAARDSKIPDSDVKAQLAALKNKPLKSMSESDKERLIDDSMYSGPEAAARMEQRYTDAGLKGSMLELVNQAYNYTDEQSGLTSTVNLIVPTTSGSSVAGIISNSNGDIVGHFNRRVNVSDRSVFNQEMQLFDNAQGNGFGRRFYRNAEEAYLQAGIERVDMYANIDVGGYAWARMGYNYADPKVGARHITDFNRINGANLPIDTPAWKLAAASGSSMSGKDFLLDTNWNATKRLDIDDEGFIAGYEYATR